MLSVSGNARWRSAFQRRLEESLAAARVSQDLAATIAQCVSRARLRRDESDDVAEELVSHFLDGLERGRTAEELISEFGRPEVAARLIGRSVRRLRPPIWHFGQGVAATLGAILLVLTGIYLASLARLHSGRPASGAREPGTPPAVLRSWAPFLRALRDSRAKGAAILARAQFAAGRGDRAGMMTELSHALAATEELQRVSVPAYELDAIDLAARAAVTVRALSREHPDLFSLHDLAAFSERLRALCGQRLCWRPSTIRVAFRELVAAMYTDDGRGDGHLTAAGLRIFQAWKGKAEPDLKALLLEPAYFWRPASRRELVFEFDRVLDVAIADRGAFSHELLRFEESPGWRLRYLPLEIPLEHLRWTLARSQDLEGRIAEGFGRVERASFGRS